MNDTEKGVVAGVWFSWAVSWAAWLLHGGSFPGPGEWMAAEGALFAFGIVLPVLWKGAEFVEKRASPE